MPKRSSKGDRTTDDSTNVDVSVSGSTEVDLMVNGTRVRLAVKRGRKRRRHSEPESVALVSQDNVPFFQRQWHRNRKASLAPFTGGVCAGLAHDLGINPL